MERRITLETSWVQMCGDTVVRCDDEAKENNWGLWVTEKIGGYRRSWIGRRPGPANGLIPYFPEAALWIRDEWRTQFVDEKDYS